MKTAAPIFHDNDMRPTDVECSCRSKNGGRGDWCFMPNQHVKLHHGKAALTVLVTGANRCATGPPVQSTASINVDFMIHIFRGGI